MAQQYINFKYSIDKAIDLLPFFPYDFQLYQNGYKRPMNWGRLIKDDIDFKKHGQLFCNTYKFQFYFVDDNFTHKLELSKNKNSNLEYHMSHFGEFIKLQNMCYGISKIINEVPNCNIKNIITLYLL